jgi:effector-binding domain-containing protein
MFKIGDFSRLSRVPVKTLRYYDEIGLLKPVRVDEFTGYRYYAAAQLPRLYRIIGLKDLGLSLEEIAPLLDENLDKDGLAALLRAKYTAIEQHLRSEKDRLRRVEEYLKRLEKEKAMPDYEVVLKKLPALTVAGLRETIPSYDKVGKLYEQIFPVLGRKRVKFAGPPMAIYYDHEYRESDVDVEAAVPIAGSVASQGKITVHELPEVAQAACVIHQGPYTGLSEAYLTLMGWVAANGYQISGPNREVYLKGPGLLVKPEKYITEIQLPVSKQTA